MSTHKIKEIKKIAVIRTDRIGEVLLSTPVIAALKKYFPDAGISFVTSPYARDIVSGRADIDEAINFGTIQRKVFLWEALPLAAALRRRRFDMAVILNPHKVLHLAVFLACIPVRLGFDRKWGFLLTHKIKDRRGEGNKHEVNYNLELLEAIGIKEKDIAPFISIQRRDSYHVQSFLGHFDVKSGRKTVVIHPGTSNPAKQWPLENFARLIRLLDSSGNFNIALTGDKSEKTICDRLISESGAKNIANLCGSFRLGGLAALFKEAGLVIANDSGPMHIAQAAGAKVIAIFGRNIPGAGPLRWGPFGKGHIVFHKNPGCKPCHDAKCHYNFKCLRAVTPEEVYEAVRKIIKADSSAPSGPQNDSEQQMSS